MPNALSCALFVKARHFSIWSNMGRNFTPGSPWFVKVAFFSLALRTFSPLASVSMRSLAGYNLSMYSAYEMRSACGGSRVGSSDSSSHSCVVSSKVPQAIAAKTSFSSASVVRPSARSHVVIVLGKAKCSTYSRLYSSSVNFPSPGKASASRGKPGCGISRPPAGGSGGLCGPSSPSFAAAFAAGFGSISCPMPTLRVGP
mmetsp:Transcript_43523/g.79231  ORF Transcript_43523/g.79231 Transcript_43523/m.79231 type:complete len:200 (+) Transcript_43523:1176-1775(+)